MLNIRSDVPIKQDAVDAVQELFAQIRDLTLEAEQLLKLATQEKVLLTREEVAKLLRCDESKVPKVIPSIRTGRKRLFEQKDVYAFIESKKHKRP